MGFDSNMNNNIVPPHQIDFMLPPENKGPSFSLPGGGQLHMDANIGPQGGDQEVFRNDSMNDFEARLNALKKL